MNGLVCLSLAVLHFQDGEDGARMDDLHTSNDRNSVASHESSGYAYTTSCLVKGNNFQFWPHPQVQQQQYTTTVYVTLYVQ